MVVSYAQTSCLASCAGTDEFSDNGVCKKCYTFMANCTKCTSRKICT